MKKLKTGRNDPCPCGSGKKYKRCCMASAAVQNSELADDMAQAFAMNPSLSIDELNVLAQSRMEKRNSQALDDFFGLSPEQMANWLHSSLADLEFVEISTPVDLSRSPVMRYLALILDACTENDGSIKATAKGNLPQKLVKKASAILPELPVAPYAKTPSISEYQGINEDSFNALHYARLLAEIAGIIELQSGRFCVQHTWLVEYHQHGISRFFQPMLMAAVDQFNWGYFDGFSGDVDLRRFWVFMLWRLQAHASVDTLIDDLSTAFPPLLLEIGSDIYRSEKDTLDMLVESRFIGRFLQFWGFVVLNPRRFADGKKLSRNVEVQPLFRDTFNFLID